MAEQNMQQRTPAVKQPQQAVLLASIRQSQPLPLRHVLQGLQQGKQYKAGLGLQQAKQYKGRQDA